MIADYVLFVRSEVVEFYRSLSRAEKDALARFFHLLEHYPTLKAKPPSGMPLAGQSR